MTKPRVAVVIQHVKTRDHDPVYHHLLTHLKRERVDPWIRTDQLANGNHGDTWKTYQRCLEVASAARGASHLLVLQDDVGLCPNFMPTIRRAVQARPDRLLSFFISHLPQSSHNRQVRAYQEGWAWSYLDREEWTPAQALCWPRWMIPGMIEHQAASGYRGPWRADDECIGRYLRDTRVDALQSCPSLVEHVHHSTTSLVMVNTNTGIQRSAWLPIGDTPPLSIDWTRGPE